MLLILVDESFLNLVKRNEVKQITRMTTMPGLKRACPVQEELDEVMDAIECNVEAASTVREVVRPLIDRVRYSEKCYAMVEEMLLASPQCQKLRKENEELRARLESRPQQEHDTPNIFVHISERDQVASVAGPAAPACADIKKVRTNLPPSSDGVPATDKIALFGRIVDGWHRSGAPVDCSVLKNEFDRLFRPYIMGEQEQVVDDADDAEDADDAGTATESPVEGESASQIEIRSDSDDSQGNNDGEFTCKECKTTQGLNNCERCDAENVCEACHGEGGDYGPDEIWVCNDCLPVCLGCEKKLVSATQECCGKGRSDIEEEEEDVEEEDAEEEDVEEEDVEEEDVEEEDVEEEDVEEEEEAETDGEEPVPTGERKAPVDETDAEENAEEEEEEEGVFEIEMEDEDGNPLRYYTNNEENGDIYEILEDEDIGPKIGKFVDGEPEFFE